MRRRPASESKLLGNPAASEAHEMGYDSLFLGEERELESLGLPLGAIVLFLRADRFLMHTIAVVRLVPERLATLFIALSHLVLLTRSTPAKLSDAGVETPGEFRDAFGPEEQQENDQQDDQLSPADIREHPLYLLARVDLLLWAPARDISQ